MNHIMTDNQGVKSIVSKKNGKIDERLFSEVVHKMKNSLGGISGFATLLEKDLGEDDPRMRLVKRIQDGVVKMNQLIMDLTTLVSISKPQFEKVHLRSMINSSWISIYEDGKLLEKLIEVDPDLKEDALQVRADPHLMRKLFFHAIRFTQLVGKKIIKIEFNSRSKESIDIEFSFLRSNSFRNLQGNVKQIINHCESIEVKLSLSIILKMVELHQGNVSLKSKSGNQRILAIHLLKGN